MPAPRGLPQEGAHTLGSQSRRAHPVPSRQQSRTPGGLDLALSPAGTILEGCWEGLGRGWLSRDADAPQWHSQRGGNNLPPSLPPRPPPKGTVRTGQTLEGAEPAPSLSLRLQDCVPFLLMVPDVTPTPTPSSSPRPPHTHTHSPRGQPRFWGAPIPGAAPPHR